MEITRIDGADVYELDGRPALTVIEKMLGLPLGGALLAGLGLEAVVIVDCATFVAAAGLVAPIAAPPRPTRAVAEVALSAWASFWSEWVAGLQLVGRHRTIALLFALFGLMTFGGTMLDPLNVAWVRDVLGRGPDVFALLMTAHAASGIVGAVAVGSIGARVAPAALIGWGSVVAGLALLVKWNVPSLPLALSLSVVGGLTSVASAVGAETLAQRSVSDEYRGRVFGSLGATLGLLSLAGAAVGGALGEVVGTVAMLNVASVLTVVAGVVALRAFGAESSAGRLDDERAAAAAADGLGGGGELPAAEEVDPGRGADLGGCAEGVASRGQRRELRDP
jgi:hypothetical protein